MEPHQKQFFRDQLRSARAVALADAEGFQAVLHSLESIGQQMLHKVASLAKYEPKLSTLASVSPLSIDIPSKWPGCHTSFPALFNELRQARNDAVHQGTYARTLTNHAVELTIILEDSLMSDASMVSQFMVREVVEARPWHPVSFVRQQMLKYAFSYLPVRDRDTWSLIPEYSVARYLRSAPSQTDRKKRLVTAVCDAVAMNELELLKPHTVSPDALISDTLPYMGERPVLVVDRAHADLLVGVLTSSDIL